jgi:phosphate butyryltransferase
MVANLESLLDFVKQYPKKTIAVAAAEDIEVLEVVELATSMNIAEFILIGKKVEIEEIAKEHNKRLQSKVIDQPDHKIAAERAVALVVEGKANAVMKGLLHTGIFLKAVLDKEKGLNKGKLISQITVFDKEYGEGLQLATDCAISIEPNIEEKKHIIENAIELAKKLGIELPMVALLSAVETVNQSIKDTVEAAVLSKMAERGQIKGAIIDGPLALDNAISKEAAEHKGIKGVVAGHADILIVPNLQAGNVLHKSLTYFARKDIASAIMGAKAPIILTSRTDSVKNKLLTVALACYIS